MPIYLQWDSRVIGIPFSPVPQGKKMIHMNTKFLDLVTAGQAWDTCQRLWISKPPTTGSLKPAKTTDKSPNMSKQGPKLFLFFGRQNRFCFLKIILRVETISMVSSNETLPNMQCTRAHCPGPSGSTSVLYRPLPLRHTVEYMSPGLSAIIFSLSGVSPNKCLAHLGVVKCNCRQRVKQMLTLGFLLNSEVVNIKLMNLGLCPDCILEYFMCPRFPLECSESYWNQKRGRATCDRAWGKRSKRHHAPPGPRADGAVVTQGRAGKR